MTETRTSTCQIGGCEKRVKALGYCNAHYLRVKRHGSAGGSKSRVYGSALDRIAAYTEIRDDGCIVWTASLAAGGYGQMRDKGTIRRSHIVSYELLVGPVPEGLVLDHLCRVRACVNPDHLEAVTVSTNTRRGVLGYEGRAKCRAGLHDITDPANIYNRRDGQRECLPCCRRRKVLLRGGAS